MIRVATGLCAALFALGSLDALSAESAPDLQQRTLSNGLQVVVKIDRRAPVAVSMLWYRVGSIDEVNGRTGLSHMLEHMMFKGTREVPAGEFSRTIARAGGRANAFTSRDQTVYHESMHKSGYPLALRLEADRMANLALAPDEFAKELRVVMEERRQRIEDNAHALLEEQLLAAALIANPARTPIVGWMDDLEHMTVEDARGWYRTWYAPDNAMLVVAGDVDPEQVFTFAERHFGPIPARTLPERKEQKEPPQRGMRHIVVKAPADLPHVALAYRVPALRSLDNDWEPFALSILSGVLDGYDAARLIRELVKTSRVAQSVDTSYEIIGRGPGLFFVSGAPAGGHTVQEFEAAWREQLHKLLAEGVADDELKRAKAQVVAAHVYQQDSIFAQASQIGRLWIVGLPYDAGPAILRKLQAVTAAQVRDVARKYLVDDNLTIAELDPQPVDPNRARRPRDARR